jgi:hypothetical protein
VDITRRVLGIVFILVVAIAAGVAAIDVSITVPTVSLTNLPVQIDQATIDQLNAQFTTELQNLADQLTVEIENDPELNKFSRQPLLTEGFANAGAAAAHLGTQRAFSDYRAFALMIGTGAAISGPGIDPSVIEGAAGDIETEGDIYLGAAVQPVTVSLGINLSRWIPRTRADVKVGYANIAKGTLADEVAFNALSVGVGANYQILQSRQLPLGFIRWRGVSLASGFMFQRNEVTIEVDVADGAFEATELTFGDVFTDPSALALLGVSETTEFGTLSVLPTLDASIESRTYSIPLEATTGLRLLWLLDVNVGAGVDLVFGSSDIAVGASAEADFVPSVAARQYVSTTPGTAAFGISTSEGPQFLRPRLTGGVGLNLGPVKLDVPMMLYFDSEGNSAMVGVNLGIVW